MSKYGWNLEDLRAKALTTLEKSKRSNSLEERENYFNLYQEYVRLINIVLVHDDIAGYEKKPSGKWLKEIRRTPSADDYDSRTKEIRKKILDSFKDFPVLPSPHYAMTLDQDFSINLLGDIILDVFGDDNYEVYKERILSSPEMLQFTKGDRDSLTSLFVVGDRLDIYTSVPDVKNLSFLTNLLHESGHTYRLVKNEYLVSDQNKLKEFEAFSYEIRALDYMINHNMCREEAIKAMIKLFNRIEALIHTLKNVEIERAKHLQHLTFMAHNSDLYSKAHFPNNYELLRYLEFVKCEYVLPYIYSALAVFDTLESDTDLEKYREVISNIGKVDEDKIALSIVDNPIDFNNLENYRKYRNKILGLYNGR